MRNAMRYHETQQASMSICLLGDHLVVSQYGYITVRNVRVVVQQEAQQSSPCTCFIDTLALVIGLIQ